MPVNTQQGAREILAHLQAVYVPEHDYVSVRETDYPHLDLNFYRRARAEFEAEQFVHLGDCEDRTLTAAPGNVLLPVMIRVLVSADGTVSAGVYHPRIKPLLLRGLLFVTGRLPGTIIDLETEFDDGSFLCTTTAPESRMAQPALIRIERLPPNTSVAQLLSRHRARIAERQAQTGAVPRRARTLEAVRAAQNRMNAIQAAFRGEIGGITRAELEQLGGGGRAQAHEVHAEIQKIQAEPSPVPNDATAIVPTAAASGAGAPSSAAAEADDFLLAQVRARGEATPASGISSQLLLITAVLFIAIGGMNWGWRTVVFLAVAIAIHELGHVLAMRVFGYKNVRMLFLPFFGGLATGEPRELDATKNALVSLAGPVVGIASAALAGALALVTGAPPWLVEFAWTSLFLNAFNLLPLVPLDGGQFANDTLFSRFPVLELLFRLLAVAGLGWLAWRAQTWILGIVAGLMLLSTPAAFRRARILLEARRDPAWQTRPLDREAIAALRGLVGQIHAGAAEKAQGRLPEQVHGVWLEIRKRFPGPGRTVGLLAGYLVLCAIVIPVIAVLLATLLPRPAM